MTESCNDLMARLKRRRDLWWQIGFAFAVTAFVAAALLLTLGCRTPQQIERDGWDLARCQQEFGSIETAWREEGAPSFFHARWVLKGMTVTATFVWPVERGEQRVDGVWSAKDGAPVYQVLNSMVERKAERVRSTQIPGDPGGDF